MSQPDLPTIKTVVFRADTKIWNGAAGTAADAAAASTDALAAISPKITATSIERIPEEEEPMIHNLLPGWFKIVVSPTLSLYVDPAAVIQVIYA